MALEQDKLEGVKSLTLEDHGPDGPRMVMELEGISSPLSVRLSGHTHRQLQADFTRAHAARGDIK